ncbi:hypothetical protein ACFVKB_37810 [Rhodococcus sp. NPDC127530]|uniref:hypothetical protein n=1 Tax=unclassified Rhodococcus (in: high G+C Gram-positive bacteria) TaxID=192944 RepID=UPI00363EFD88
MISPPSRRAESWSQNILIDGEPGRRLHGPDHIVVGDPATDETLTELRAASSPQVGQAFEAARRAFESDAWKDRGLLRRQFIVSPKSLA